MQRIKFILLFLIACISNSVSMAQSSTFEDFSEVPERTVFDLYVGGEFSGSMMGTFTSEWAEFDNPEDIPQQIPNLLQPQALIPLFNQRITTGDGLEIDSIGRITVQPQFFRVDVEVDQSQLEVKRIAPSSFERIEPEEKLSVRQGLRLTGNTDFDAATDDPYSLYHNTLISNGRSRLDWGGNVVKKSGYDLNTLAYSHDEDEHIFSTGLLETPGTNFMSSQRYIGFSYKTNREIYADQARLEGSYIDVFVPSKSHVKIYRGESDNIIYNRILNFGLQEIDTSRFPQGSYDVRIVIEDENGRETVERRRYTKTDNLAKVDEPYTSFDFGIIREDDFKLTDVPIMQWVHAQRVSENVELETSLYGTPDIIVLEPSIKSIWDNYRLESGLSISHLGDVALRGNLRYNTQGNLSINLNGTHTLVGHDYLDDTTYNFEDSDARVLLSSKRTTISADISKGLGKFTLNYGATYSKYGDREDPDSYSYGPKLIWVPYTNQFHQIRTEVSHNNTQDGRNTRAVATYRYNPEGLWSTQSGINRTRGNGVIKSALQVGATYDSRANQGKGTYFNINNQLSHERESNENNADAHLLTVGDSSSLRVIGQWQTNAANQAQDNTNINVEAETTMLFTPEAGLEFKPDVKSEPVFIAELSGSAIGEEMVILVDGRELAYASVGQSTAVKLQPYDTHNITIKPRVEGTFVNYDTAAYSITVFPGNIGRHTWEVNKALFVMGRVVGLDGQPITWSRIQGIDTFGTTDANGAFQIEYLGKKTPFISNSKYNCTIALPPIKIEGYFQHVGDVVCG